MPHPKWTLCLVLLAPALCPEAFPQSRSPLGMVIQVSGEAVLQRGTEKKNAQLADLLFPADKLSVNSGEVGIIFCPSTERMVLKKGTLAEFSAAQVRVIKGPPPVRERDRKCALPQVSLGSESMERIGATRPRGYPPIPLYLGGSVSSSRPVFRWAGLAGVARYNVTLRDQNGTAFWRTSTESTELSYPDSEPALDEKDYSWEVWAEKDGRTVAQQSASFHVKLNKEVGDFTPQQIPNIQVKPGKEFTGSSPQQTADKLLRAIALENAGYFSEAAVYFRELRDANPADTRLTNHLIWLYSNAGLSAAVNEELKKLEK
ncbi:MAG TPA: hypothetical protein VGK99_20610 [Acidobacteriota bacterium]|jgi:hypothetical protein